MPRLDFTRRNLPRRRGVRTRKIYDVFATVFQATADDSESVAILGISIMCREALIKVSSHVAHYEALQQGVCLINYWKMIISLPLRE